LSAIETGRSERRGRCRASLRSASRSAQLLGQHQGVAVEVTEPRESDHVLDLASLTVVANIAPHTWTRIAIGFLAEATFLAYAFVLGRQAAARGHTGDLDPQLLEDPVTAQA
jgi:hypothetical protein